MRPIKPLSAWRHRLKLSTWIVLAVWGLAMPALDALADSMTVSETWKDNTQGGVYSSSTDTGTFTASLTIPGLSSFTANDWSNLVVTINSDSADSLFTGEDFSGSLGDFSDFMADAPNFGGSVSATAATFIYQLPDTNGNPQNAFQLSLSRSANTLTITGKTLNPPSLGTAPWSIVAWNYFDPSGLGASFGITNDPIDCEVTLQDQNTLDEYADIDRTISVNGNNLITYDSDGYELFNIKVTGAANFTPPVLTAVSPTGSQTTTNDLLTAKFKATDTAGVANVEFFLNGSDYGSGVIGSSNLWFLSFALQPGTNIIQALATDVSGNTSPSNTVFVSYANRQTNANTITFSEQWLDSTQTDYYGDQFDVSQDYGTLNAALAVPGLQSMSASTWSNLIFTVSFGNIVCSNSLSLANVLTTNKAVFYLDQVSDPNANLVTDVQISLTRSANTLVLACETANPTYDLDNPIIADFYLGENAPFQDAETFALGLQDGNTLNSYAEVSRAVYITGTDSVTYDAQTNELDNLQVSGAADYTPPVLTAVSPVGSLTATNDLLTAQVKATDNIGVANVEFFLNGSDYGSGVIGASNLWFLSFALLPGTNVIQAFATDVGGNNSPTNTIFVTYVNKQTNANAITFSEHWLDSTQTDYYGDQFDVSQDYGTLNAALLVPGLQSLSAATWSNLSFTISFGDIAYSNSLSLANVLTTNKAVFYLKQVDDPNAKLVTDAQMSLTRSGNTLVLACETANPTYDMDNPIIANSYLGWGGVIQDTQPLVLTLRDGNTLNYYSSIARPLFITGSDATNFDSAANELNNLQISGQADFVPPTNQITAPLPNQLWSNGLFTVTGKAGDNVQVSRVFCSVNAGTWTAASLTNNGTKWSAQVTLTPGTNNIAAYAVDTSGNFSPTNNVNMVYVLSAMLTVSTNGRGAITPNDNGALLQIGKSYTLTATVVAGSGFAFTNWTGGTSLPLSILTNRATLVFEMATNLMLQANFVDTNKPVCSITNLVASQQVTNTVFTVRGRASDNVQVASVWLQFNGGAWSNPSSTNSWTNWNAVLDLLPGSNRVAAYAVDTSGNISPTNSLAFICAPAGAAFPIATGNGVQIGASAALSNTNYLAAILGSTSGATNLTAQRFSATGGLLGTRLATGRTGDVPGGLPMIASSGSNYLMVWQDNAANNALPYGQFISGTGTLQGPAFPVSTHGSAKINLAAPNVAFGGGQFLMVWNDDRNGNYNSYGRLVTTGGTLSPEIQISTAVNNETEPAVAFDGTNFLVVWEHQTSSAPEEWDVYAALVATNGLVGSPFPINQTSSPRYNPLAVAFDGNNYMAVWNRDNGGGGANPTDWGIYGAVVTPAGAVSVTEFPVATDAGNQMLPQLAFGQGNYLITWSGNLGTASNTVTARFFNSQGQPNGPEFTPFGANGLNKPLLAGVTYDGTRFVSVATLGVISTSTHLFTSGAVYGAFIAALAAGSHVVQTQPIEFTSNPGGLMLVNGSLQVHLSGPADAMVVIENSSDLIHWQPVQTNTLPVAGTNLSLHVDSRPAEFIRARVP